MFNSALSALWAMLTSYPDPADDGPEVNVIRFFKVYPDGLYQGMAKAEYYHHLWSVVWKDLTSR